MQEVVEELDKIQMQVLVVWEEEDMQTIQHILPHQAKMEEVEVVEVVVILEAKILEQGEDLE